MNNLVIRHARPDDVESIEAIAYKCWHDTYDDIVPRVIQDEYISSLYAQKMIQQRMQNGLMLVALIGSEMIGFASFSNPNDAGESKLHAIYLLDSAQRCGVGSVLLERAIRELSDLTTLVVDVEKANDASVHFYEDKGFVQLRETDEIFKSYHFDKVQMKYDVPS